MKHNKPISFDHRKEYKRRKNLAYLFLAAVTAIVWLVMLIVKIVTAVHAGGALSEVLSTIRDGIFDNILGILPPILLFDFWLEYLQQDKIFDEMTEQITGTIMSKPEVIQSFDKEAKKRFLRATVLTLVDQNEDECSMAMAALEPYINDKFDIRKDFSYFLEIRECESIKQFDADKYMFIYENLSYELLYVATEPIKNSVHIDFFIENSKLDKSLREQKHNESETARYIMSEGLDIDIDDFEAIRSKTSDKKELIEYITQLFIPQLYIEDIPWLVNDVSLNDNKIDIEFVPQNDPVETTADKSSRISLSFRMPQLKTHTSFLASISQPTYNPTIRLSYPEEKYDIKLFPFFNSSLSASVSKAEQGIGCRNIQVKDKWVHPMSGVVFLIDKK